MQYAYSDVAKTLVKEFKFNGKRAAAKELAALMTFKIPKERSVVLVHIPTATGRIRERGYDHAKLLAAALSSQTGISHLSLLGRTSQARQLGTGRSERLKNMKDAFKVMGDVTDAHIILVDDVVTTGATLSEAARVLKLGGARYIDAVVFATTLR